MCCCTAVEVLVDVSTSYLSQFVQRIRTLLDEKQRLERSAESGKAAPTVDELVQTSLAFLGLESEQVRLRLCVYVCVGLSQVII